jgi:hypothetical protein
MRATLEWQGPFAVRRNGARPASGEGPASLFRAHIRGKGPKVSSGVSGPKP